MQRLKNKRAEGYVDSGVKILIAVVIGALLLTGLYALFHSTVMPSVEEKVTAMFNYSQPGGTPAGGNAVPEDEGNYAFISVSDFEQYMMMSFKIDNHGDRFVGFTVDGERPTFNYDCIVSEDYHVVDVYRVVLEPGLHTFRFDYEN